MTYATVQVPLAGVEDQDVLFPRLPVKGDCVDFAEMHPVEEIAGETYEVGRVIFQVGEDGEPDRPVVVLRSF